MRRVPCVRSQTGLTRSQYKVYCYYVLKGRQLSGTGGARGAYWETDDVTTMSGRTVAGACHIDEKTVDKAIRELRRRGLLVRQTRDDRSGSRAFMPIDDGNEGWTWVMVDEREALKCFAFGSPDASWDVYALACAGRASVSVADPWGELGRMVGTNANAAEWAYEWLAGQKMVGRTQMWEDGVAKWSLESR